MLVLCGAPRVKALPLVLYCCLLSCLQHTLLCLVLLLFGIQHSSAVAGNRSRDAEACAELSSHLVTRTAANTFVSPVGVTNVIATFAVECSGIQQAVVVGGNVNRDRAEPASA